jgi:glycosyltransferase involved in cell wall biosynthesis
LRILHLVHQYLPESIGGTELYTRNLAQYQVGQGHRVSLFTVSGATATSNKDTPSPAEEEGVRVYRVPVGSRSPQAIFFSLFHQKRIGDAFTAVLDQEQPDMIHLQHLMGLPVEVMNQVASRRIPFIVTLHDYWYACANAQLLTNYDATICPGPGPLWLNCARCALARAGRSGGPWLPATAVIAPIMALRARKLRAILAEAQLLIAPTDFVRATYRDLGFAAEKIRVIAHGINLPPSLPPRAKRPLGAPLHAAYIGGLAWQKGVHVLIDAVKRLPPETIRLTVAGDTTAFPEYAAGLQAQARQNNVHFMGRLPPADLWSFLATVDVVIVPSLWYETASLIVQEAFAARVPVIASRLGALAERVRDGVDGFLVTPGDVTAMCRRLAQLQEQPALQARLQAGIEPVRSLVDHFEEVMAIYGTTGHQATKSVEISEKMPTAL